MPRTAGKRTAPAVAAWMAAAVVAFGAALPSAAQEGHPLKGSWLGMWESNETHGESILLVLDWDGEKITGVINPGTDDIAIESARLDPEGWIVTIEAEADSDSGPVHYVIEGTIQNLELPNRSIIGTWKHQRGGGAFDVSRQ